MDKETLSKARELDGEIEVLTGTYDRISAVLREAETKYINMSVKEIVFAAPDILTIIKMRIAEVEAQFEKL